MLISVKLFSMDIIVEFLVPGIIYIHFISTENSISRGSFSFKKPHWMQEKQEVFARLSGLFYRAHSSLYVKVHVFSVILQGTLKSVRTRIFCHFTGLGLIIFYKQKRSRR